MPRKKPASTDDPVLLLTVEETGRRLSVSRDTVYRLINRGHVDVVHIGRSARVTESSVRAYVDSLLASPFPH